MVKLGILRSIVDPKMLIKGRDLMMFFPHKGKPPWRKEEICTWLLYTTTYDQIFHGFSFLLPHKSTALSTKEKTIFHRYIHEPGVHGNNNEIIPPHVITIKIGLPYKLSQYRWNFVTTGTQNRTNVKKTVESCDAKVWQ